MLICICHGTLIYNIIFILVLNSTIINDVNCNRIVQYNWKA